MKLLNAVWCVLVLSSVTTEAMDFKKIKQHIDSRFNTILHVVKRITVRPIRVNLTGSRSDDSERELSKEFDEFIHELEQHSFTSSSQGDAQCESESIEGEHSEVVGEMPDLPEHGVRGSAREFGRELRELICELERGSLASSSQENIPSDDGCTIDPAIATVRRGIEEVITSSSPQKYNKALKLAQQKKSRRKSIQLLTELAFDSEQLEWVRNGSRTRLRSMLYAESDPRYVGLYNRLFSYDLYGISQNVKDWIETFQRLNDQYIKLVPNLHNPFIRALARYNAAMALRELKHLHEGICNQEEFARIQQLLEENRELLVRQGIILSVEQREESSQVSGMPSLD